MGRHEPQQASIAFVAKGLEKVLRHGVRPARLRECDELLALGCVRERANGAEDRDSLAFGLEAVLLDALEGLGDGPYGEAARLLFGAVSGTKGRLLKDRRRLAAEELDVLPSTFRQNYEDEILLDVGAEVTRLEMNS